MPVQKIHGLAAVAALFVALVISGCTTVPQQEFKAYTAAFDEVKDGTETLLLEFDAAEKLAAKAKASKKAASPTAFPLTVSLNMGTAPSDPVAARRTALEAVVRFNTVLTELAQGKKPEEIRSSVDSLITGLMNVADLAGTTLPISGAVVPLVTTVIGQLEKAANRAQFAEALRKGEPIIDEILRRFALDAQDLYVIRATDAIRRSGRAKAAVTASVRQMRRVALEHDNPAAAHAAKIAKIETAIRAALDRVGQTANTNKLTATPGGLPFDQLTLSQLEQTAMQMEVEAGKFEAVIAEQKAYYDMVMAYGRLLAQAGASLKAVRMAIDKPADVRAQAMELISFAFALKREREALRAARQDASGG